MIELFVYLFGGATIGYLAGRHIHYRNRDKRIAEEGLPIPTDRVGAGNNNSDDRRNPYRDIGYSLKHDILRKKKKNINYTID